MDTTAPNKRPRAKKKASDAVSAAQALVNENSVMQDGRPASRQVLRHAARRARKSYWLTPRTSRVPVLPNGLDRKIAGPGTYGRHLVEFQAPTTEHPHEGSFHYTKGVRFRRVAM